MLELCSGEHFAGCKIVCVCGKGGYGTVYLAENATLLGGYWHNGKFFWSSSKNEIKEPLSLTGQVIDTAPSLSVPAIKNGKLCAIQLPEQFLMEFPSP